MLPPQKGLPHTTSADETRNQQKSDNGSNACSGENLTEDPTEHQEEKGA